MRPASNEPLSDQARRFSEELERGGGWQNWQIRQPAGRQNEPPRTDPLAVLDELGRRLRTRH